MDFTRQPITESVITPKEGCKLVVRSSKGAGQEEYFVDAIEVVSFGNTFFFRSLEKPKSFLVPATDYEILEVREARMVLKNVGQNRSIKIGGGKDKQAKETEQPAEPQKSEEQEQPAARQTERKRDRRRSFRRRKKSDESEELVPSDISLVPPPPMGHKPIELPPQPVKQSEDVPKEKMELPEDISSSLLPPPPNLISDTIEKYKDNKLFEGAFVGTSSAKKVEETVPQEMEFSEKQEEEIVEKRQQSEASEEENHYLEPFKEDAYFEEPSSGGFVPEVTKEESEIEVEKPVDNNH